MSFCLSEWPRHIRRLRHRDCTRSPVETEIFGMRRRTRLFLPTLVQNGRDIVPVAHSVLDGISRRHRVAPIIEQLAHEQGLGALTPQASPLMGYSRFGLNRLE